MAKQSKPVELKVTVTYSPTSDYKERLYRAVELLLRPKASELLNDKANKPPLPEHNTSIGKKL